MPFASLTLQCFIIFRAELRGKMVKTIGGAPPQHEHKICLTLALGLAFSVSSAARFDLTSYVRIDLSSPGNLSSTLWCMIYASIIHEYRARVRVSSRSSNDSR